MSTDDIERRLRARARNLPQPPPLPDRALSALGQRATAAPAPSPQSTEPRRRRFGRRRVGGALAFAAIVAAGSIALAGGGRFSLPSGAREQVGIDHATVVGTVRDGTQQVIVTPGVGKQAGRICVSLANRMGPTDVSPVICQRPDQADDPGFGHAEQPDRGEGWWLHVRLPDPADPRSAIVSEATIPETGGAVTIDSGGRLITEHFHDMSRVSAASERNLAEFQEKMRQLTLAGLRTPRSRRLLAALPAEQREALRLRVVNRLSYPQIAARQGVDPSVVRHRISRAIRTLGIDLHGMLP